jgi:hypothetical protein
MRKHIRAIIDDLRKQVVPRKKVKASPAKTNPVMPQDLDNQTLSDDPEQRKRQLDWQAQKSEERQNS